MNTHSTRVGLNPRRYGRFLDRLARRVDLAESTNWIQCQQLLTASGNQNT